jgi:hypothetical protein
MLTLLQALPVEGPHGRVRVVTRFGGAVFPAERARTSEDLLREANKSFRALQASELGKYLFDA